MTFEDRQDAGQQLATALKKYKNNKNTYIMALPRGGVVIGHEVAKKLKLPLDVVVPRKIGAPYNEEYGIGAITETGRVIYDDEAIKSVNATKEYISKKVKEETREAKRRINKYRGSRPPLELKNKTVILVDDGIATGLTMQAAIRSVKDRKAKKVIVAVPLSAKDSLKKIKKEADEVVCLDVPIFFTALGSFYGNFEQTTDKEVIKLLAR
jgi:putative phosphoribosyl transferase